MKRFRLVLFLLWCLPYTLFAQIDVKEMGRVKTDPTDGVIVDYITAMTRKKAYVFTIGVRKFKDKSFDTLESALALNEYLSVAHDFLPSSYITDEPVLLNGDNITSTKVLSELDAFTNRIDASSVVFISILSHGEVSDGEYYLICSNTDSNNFSSTAVSGKQLRFFFERMATKGALVLVFVDTCKASALFDNTDFNVEGDGSIIYFASSMKDEEAKQIENKSLFSSTVLKIFRNEIDGAFFNDIVLLKSFFSHIKSGVGIAPEDFKQTPVARYCSNNKHIADYPIIKRTQFRPYGSIFSHSRNFLPWTLSPNEGKTLDWVYIGTGSLSLIGFVSFGIWQENLKKLINNETNIQLANEYRRKGKDAAIGCWVCLGVLAGSYILKTVNVFRNDKKLFRETQFSKSRNSSMSLSFSPTVIQSQNTYQGNNYTLGLSLVCKF